MSKTTWKNAESKGLKTRSVDIQADYKEEVQLAMHKAIARAWSDPAYKKALIADPVKKLAEFGVFYPDHYKLQFVDDPSAKVGDWTSTGKAQSAVLRIPIPPAPKGGNVADGDLKVLASAGDDCCCCSGLCTCTGAASQDTWY